ncbi:MAG: hypothetical protein CSA81_05060 [Acidobacteria bacterium]|nr:MAG: hypothetical protein CSA81_05060 [Acidobacteriota bacterium]PIE91041.1 MAG: hypothetical protein CR997_02675 [Acidobacteriota bacterium]
MMDKNSFEKLDLFYLGKEKNIQTGEDTAYPLLYKNKNLTTHAVVIGMTGSGKTGLGVGLIEEAAIDGIPSIVIDPKGDMANLLLTFPELRGKDFEPWIDPADARRKKLSIPELAEKTAQKWEAGINSYGQDKSRIAALKSKAEFTVYTPGHTAGNSVSILKQFDAPSEDLIRERSTLNSLINATVTSLLALIDISADPLKSREHILISCILLHYWTEGKSLTMEELIGQVVSPPFQKIGVFPLDQFYPQSKRMDLAMQLNNILASPGFSAWIQGEPLDIQEMLYTPEGKPRVCIFSISHLSDSERMFFVTLLLNRFISWMRRQEGSSALKACLYMDEIFGFFPPTANPPSKKPMLLLLKQARAFGVGVILATQNPVDLDYKGLSNIGTWFIGRLQTPQDQKRVIDGIRSSAKNMDEKTIANQLANMKSRTFLLHSVHNDGPLLFGSRWVLSYLKGPISLSDIAKLKQASQGTNTVSQSSPALQKPQKEQEKTALQQRPILSTGVLQKYALPLIPLEELHYTPSLMGTATVRFFNAKRGIDESRQLSLILRLDANDQEVDWKKSQPNEYKAEHLLPKPPAEKAVYSPLPSDVQEQKTLSTYEKALSDFVYRNYKLDLLTVPELKLESRPDESTVAFQSRIADAVRAEKDKAMEKMTSSYQTKLDRIEKKIDSAYAKIDKEKADVKAKTVDTALSFGVAVLGALFGRKGRSSRIGSRSVSSMKGASRVYKERGDVKRAEELASQLEKEHKDLVSEMEVELHRCAAQYDPSRYQPTTLSISPRRQDVFDVEVTLLWEPELDLDIM